VQPVGENSAILSAKAAVFNMGYATLKCLREYVNLKHYYHLMHYFGSNLFVLYIDY
jgi:hypothetical protein